MQPRTMLLAASLLVLLGAASAAAEPIKLVTPVVYGTHLPGLGEPALQLAALVKQLSEGDIVFDLKQPGDGTEPQEILDKVSSGAVDAGFSTASFWEAKLPASPLFSGFPFGPDAKAYVDWFYAGNGRKLYQELYDQGHYHLHVIPCAFGGAETSGWFAKEIKTPDDIKGLHIRAFGLDGRVMAKLGAVPVLIPGGALGQAFDKHQIDAAELYTPAVDARQGLQSHVKRIYVPGWHQPETVLELLINKDRWAALDDQQQALVEIACQSLLLRTLAQSAALQRDALADLAAKDKVEIETWPPEVLAAFRTAWNQVAQEEAGADPFFKEVLDDLDGFRAKQAWHPPSTARAPQSQAAQQPSSPP